MLESAYSRPGRYVAIDCEMVGVGTNGSEDSLARVSIVNFHGNVLLDCYVAPTQRITDFRTKFSGIRPSNILNPDRYPSCHPSHSISSLPLKRLMGVAQSFDVIQKKVSDLLQNRILIGHSLKSDLSILKLSHPKYLVRDTCLYEPFRVKYGSGKTPSLKKIVWGELGVHIQTFEHDSVWPLFPWKDEG